MSGEEVSFFGGFEALTSSLSNRAVGNSTQNGNFDPEDDNYPEVEPDEIDTDADENTEDDDNDTGAPADTSIGDDTDAEESEEDGDEKGEKGTADLGEAEPEISQFLQEKLAEELGWEFGEDDKFESVKEVVDFLKEVVEANSKPNFANEELELLNSFVANGGSVEEYLKTAHGEVNLESIDLSSPSNQKSVIKELLKEKGYNESRITRSIERYEDAGTLEEEAEDAKELLAEIRENKSKKLLETKEKEKTAILEQQQKYVESVEQTVNTLDSVRGIPISDKEKKQLMDYIFKPAADGRTPYQKDYMSNVKNLIESAYFTMKGDAFVQKVQRKANSDAAMNLKKKLSTKGNGQKPKSEGGISWNLFSGQLRKPNR